MAAPEYRRLAERIRELATAEAGTLRTIPLGRLAEELPEGLEHGDEVRRTMPREDRPDGQPRIELKPIRLRGRRHPPTGSKQIRTIEVELRVVRALPLDTIKDDDARYDQHGLATEDGELLARVLELPINLERTSSGELTGCRSLVHVSSDPVVRGSSKGAGAPQRLETVHRFRGWMVVDVPIAAAPEPPPDYLLDYSLGTWGAGGPRLTDPAASVIIEAADETGQQAAGVWDARLNDSCWTMDVWPTLDSASMPTLAFLFSTSTAAETLFFSSGDLAGVGNGVALFTTFALTYAAGQRLTIVMDFPSSQITVSGATTGNGTRALARSDWGATPSDGLLIGASTTAGRYGRQKQSRPRICGGAA